MGFILHRKLLFNTLKKLFPGDRPTVWYSTKAGQTSGGCQSEGPRRAPEPVPKPQTTLGSTGIEQWQSAFTMEVPLLNVRGIAQPMRVPTAPFVNGSAIAPSGQSNVNATLLFIKVHCVAWEGRAAELAEPGRSEVR
jgi:hypothetical protein